VSQYSILNLIKRVALHLLVAIFCCVSLSALSQDGLDLATPTNAVDELDGEEATKVTGPSFDSKNSPSIGNNPTLSIGDDGKVGKSSALPAESSTPAKVAPALTPAVGSAVENLDDEILVGDFSSLPASNDFSGAPPIPGTMRLLADEEAPEDYVIEDGDTLIDICDQLLDEPGYWPKLWALNPEIKNPHFIFPLMRLRFYPGDDENPPYLQVVAEEDTVPIDKADLEETQLVAERVERVEKSDKPETIVFPSDKEAAEDVSEVIGADQVDNLAEQPLMGGRIYNASAIDVQLPGFIYSRELEPKGTVLVGRMGQISAQQGDEVLLSGGSSLKSGSRYTVLRPRGEISNPDTGEFVGYRYDFVANVRIARALGDDRFRAVIDFGRLPVSPEDLVVNLIATSRSVPINEQVGSLKANRSTIIGWDYDGQESGARGGFAFLDKGRSAGLASGSYLPVYSTPGFLSRLSGDADIPVDYKMIGAMLIVDVTDVAAVGYVVNSSSELRVGDVTGKP